MPHNYVFQVKPDPPHDRRQSRHSK
jgi:hypothetical protein